MATTLSANVDDKMAQKVRSVAEREHRSVSNVVSSALAVFTALPKDVRDMLLELQSQKDPAAARRLAREMMAAVHRIRLDMAVERIAAEGNFGGPDAGGDEMEIMEEATRLVEAARPPRPVR